MVTHRHGPWSQHENQRLVDLVTRSGPHNWVRISQDIGSRSPKQCRERYHQNLKPSTTKSHEDDKDELHNEHVASQGSVSIAKDASNDGVSSALALDQSLDANHIERWQEHAGGDLEDNNAGVVLRLLRACIDMLSCLLTRVDSTLTTKRENNILRRSHTALKLWAHDHGVWEGKLDNVLQRSRKLQHSTLAVLNPMCKVLSNGESL
jgi:hypothetical protein